MDAAAICASGFAAAVTAAALALLRRYAAWLPLAHPNDRTLHEAPIPRVGGLAIWAGALPAALVASPAGIASLAWLAALALVVAVSAIDDWRGVHPLARLAVHAIAALLAVRGIDVSLGAAGTIGAALAIVWSANLYNFMDGSDGLAAAMGAFGFGALGVAAQSAGAPSGCFFAVACASLVFLAVNAPPARMFMGDAGAVPLGFAAAVWGIAGVAAGVFPAWFVALAFLSFWSDATVTLAMRAARGAPVLRAHRSHFYQRLHRLGAGHRGTLLCFGFLMAGTAASALYTLARAPAAGWAVLAAWIAIHAAFFAAIEYHWRKRCLPVQ